MRAPLDRLERRVPLSGPEGIAGLILLFTLLLVTRPYEGILHDAMLYAAQALHRIDGRFLGEDLFFRFGNQDRFSPFTRVYAPAVERFGLAPAYAGFWIAGLAGWLAGLIALSRAIFGPTRMAFAAAAAAILLNPHYGSAALAYGEGFVTPRIFAEGFGMAAVAAVLTGRKGLAALLAMMAMIAHPIMGFLFATFGLWLLLGDWRRFLAVAAAGSGAILTMGRAGIGPFGWIFETYDAAWFALLQDRHTIVLVLEWDPLVAFSTVMVPLGSLAIVAMGPDRRLTRIALAALLVPLALLALSVAAEVVLQNKFLIAMQLWRGLLILQLFGNLIALRAVLGLRPGYARTQARIVLALFYCGLEQITGSVPAGSAMIFLAALIGCFAETGRAWPGAVIRALTDVIIAAALLVTLPYLAGVPVMAWNAPEQAKLVLRLAVVAVILRTLFLPGSAAPAGHQFAIAALCLAAAFATLDDRRPYQKYVESPAPMDPALAAQLRGRAVYWEEGLALLWFKLGLPGYYSCMQWAGSVFFRDQTFETERRAQGLRGLNTGDFDDDPASGCPLRADLGQAGPVETGQLRSACGALPDLDLMILRSGQPGGYRDRLILPFASYQPVPFGNIFQRPQAEGEATAFYIYDCADFRD